MKETNSFSRSLSLSVNEPQAKRELPLISPKNKTTTIEKNLLKNSLEFLTPLQD